MAETGAPIQPATSAPTRRRPDLLAALLRRGYLAAFLLLLPAVGLRLFTVVYPLVKAFDLSFTNYNPAFPPLKYIGFANFTRITHDVGVRSSVSFTVIFVLVSTLLELALGILVASLLNNEFRGRPFVRAVNLIPWAIPMVVAALGFRWMFDKEYGIISDLFARATGVHVAWLSQFWTARFAVIATNVWKSTPFLALVFLAALQGVPSELYEAARVDGATALQMFRKITFPLILPQATTMGMFMLVWQLASFDLIYAMTGGGPGFATQVLAYNIYQAAFGGLNFGYASAISLVLFVLVVVMGGAGVLFYRRVEITY